MAMDANTLKANLKSDLMVIFSICDAGAGMTAAEYADMVSEAIASRVVEHITDNAEVNTTVTGQAGPYPTAGTGQGTVR